MTIKRFSFVSQPNQWVLDEVEFSEFNLLVGLSGVGKTRILSALSNIQSAVNRGASVLMNCQWEIEIGVGSETYIWRAKTSEPEVSTAYVNQNDNLVQPVRYEREHICMNGEILVERAESFRFKGQELPKLRETESAISLLMDESSIAPLYQAIQRIIVTEANRGSPQLANINTIALDNACHLANQFDSLKTANNLPLLVKAYIIQEKFPNHFQKLKENYKEIFDSVRDIKIDIFGKISHSTVHSPSVLANDTLVIAILEEDVSGWIVSPFISAGMVQTLLHLIELELAPAGTTFMIDEIENSLGVNCLPVLMDHFLSRSNELQFIITSHHPYVINNIPPEHWKVVTRKGPVVTVLDQASIPALQTESAHEKFTLLMNLPEYEEGIQ